MAPARLPFPWNTNYASAPQRTERGDVVQPPLMVGVTNLPVWLVPALELQSQEVPNRLDVSGIRTYTDAYQNGWAVARYLVVDFEANAAAQSPVILAATLKSVRRLVGIEVGANVLAADRRFRLVLIDPTGGEITIAAAEAISTLALGVNEILSAGIGQEIPPGFGLEFRAGTLAGAETLTCRALVADAPTGFSLR